MQGYTIQFPVLGLITSFLFSHSRDLGLSSGGSVDIKSAWSSSGRGHQVGVVIKSDDSPSGDPWFDSRSGPLLDLFLVVPISNPQERL